eukprot:Cvel_12814.t1-p1 / transcript=Cvel_12814.t1 / gene=Cvel_12814 / organism=Chromera_velia_CCMP2878 / gene_product=hypothetical protein / transcript_product=hypothetical protein / location=Cvel_scaffold854:16064-17996(-) / protein_length=409 / sequence_SO=supercontig / SO=protein_coding / is_pseudo=false
MVGRKSITRLASIDTLPPTPEEETVPAFMLWQDIWKCIVASGLFPHLLSRWTLQFLWRRLRLRSTQPLPPSPFRTWKAEQVQQTLFARFQQQQQQQQMQQQIQMDNDSRADTSPGSKAARRASQASSKRGGAHSAVVTFGDPSSSSSASPNKSSGGPPATAPAPSAFSAAARALIGANRLAKEKLAESDSPSFRRQSQSPASPVTYSEPRGSPTKGGGTILSSQKSMGLALKGSVEVRLAHEVCPGYVEFEGFVEYFCRAAFMYLNFYCNHALQARTSSRNKALWVVALASRLLDSVREGLDSSVFEITAEKGELHLKEREREIGGEKEDQQKSSVEGKAGGKVGGKDGNVQLKYPRPVLQGRTRTRSTSPPPVEVLKASEFLLKDIFGPTIVAPSPGWKHLKGCWQRP